MSDQDSTTPAQQDPATGGTLTPLLDGFLNANVRDAVLIELVPLIQKVALKVPAHLLSRAMGRLLDKVFQEKLPLYTTLIYYQSVYESDAVYLETLKKAVSQWISENAESLQPKAPEEPEKLVEHVHVHKRTIEHPDGSREIVEDWDATREAPTGTTPDPAVPVPQLNGFPTDTVRRSRVAATSLRAGLIRLAYVNQDLRAALLSLLKE